MSVSLIVTDIDGTLLNSRGEITKETREAFACADRAGILLAIGTGRVKDECIPVLRQLPQLRYCVNCTGASVFDLTADREIYADPIPMEEVLRLKRKLEGLECLFEVMADGHCYADAEGLARLLNRIDSYYTDIVRTTRTRVDLDAMLAARREPVTKLHMLFPNVAEQREAAVRMQGEPYLVLSSIPQNLEINRATSDKGSGVRRLAEYLGVPMEEVLCAGDNTNDAGMLKVAGYPVIMANSNPEILPLGKYRTLSNDENGVAHMIHRVLDGSLEQLRTGE